MAAMYATVTSKGQITLPVAARRALGSLEGQKVCIRIEGDSLIIDAPAHLELVRARIRGRGRGPRHLGAPTCLRRGLGCPERAATCRRLTPICCAGCSTMLPTRQRPLGACWRAGGACRAGRGVDRNGLRARTSDAVVSGNCGGVS
ncbi:MAG: AbrB/MazE/SpoVT family DNA-binding domain-containing protein [Candidatus Nanopelagicales bacterium]